MPLTLPGTAIPYDKRAAGDTYALISPIISATGGISLSQLAQLTGIESTTIQNWVKRGWVTPSTDKKYGERSVVRILLINIMRGTLKLEEIAQLMRIVNGDVVDMDDDILHDTQLYNLLCSVIYEVEEDKMQSADEIRIVIEDKLPDGLDDREQRILESVLMIMVQSAISGFYRQLAEDEFEELEQNSDGGGKLKLKLGV
ncbi:DNA-binding transcriptional regulator, MerR family [Ruminococcus sp. YE71]|uniref:DUF1836 domain-containing protein n=1 Tax=unclassified Ruminococcus TaxID=2608920 RepID=UPI0008906D0E|nr:MULTISPECIES: DUF1836 domain-containing protein [unclassified Ruminococcus]SDA25253.1 DNA-binding transcriptional regulator, MerR family [Ruminococcus sp. YE78]SFW42768.1 DNA-binding transcriptional regulator, MerR family [Ruminococcus sp. YE71]